MLQTFLIFASEAAEPSKVAFYVTGGILVAWALALTTVGMRSETFPTDARTSQAVVGVSFVLVVATLVAAVLTG